MTPFQLPLWVGVLAVLAHLEKRPGTTAFVSDPTFHFQPGVPEGKLRLLTPIPRLCLILSEPVYQKL